MRTFIYCILASAVVLFIVDILCSQPRFFTGVLLEKTYRPPANSHTSGVAVVPNGKGGSDVAPIYTTTHQREEWHMVLQCSDGRVITVKSDPEVYYASKPGDVVRYQTYYGLFTGWRYLSYAKASTVK